VALEILKQSEQGFICVNAHLEGYRINVEWQVQFATARGEAALEEPWPCYPALPIPARL
jgi:trans-2-enoyl-CoA reductase